MWILRILSSLLSLLHNSLSIFYMSSIILYQLIILKFLSLAQLSMMRSSVSNCSLDIALEYSTGMTSSSCLMECIISPHSSCSVPYLGDLYHFLTQLSRSEKLKIILESFFSFPSPSCQLPNCCWFYFLNLIDIF